MNRFVSSIALAATLMLSSASFAADVPAGVKAAVADKRAAAERELNQCLEEENLATAVSQPSLARFRADFPHRDAYVSPLATAARK